MQISRFFRYSMNPDGVAPVVRRIAPTGPEANLVLDDVMPHTSFHPRTHTLMCLPRVNALAPSSWEKKKKRRNHFRKFSRARMLSSFAETSGRNWNCAQFCRTYNVVCIYIYILTSCFLTNPLLPYTVHFHTSVKTSRAHTTSTRRALFDRQVHQSGWHRTIQ